MRCSLNDFLSGDKERVGLILQDGSVVELKNLHPDPEHGFLVDAGDLIEYGSRATSTWHTHPKGGLSPSQEDMEGFLMWPKLEHIIVAPEGTARFVVERGLVVRREG